MSFLFADVRGSTTLAEAMSPAAFSQLMNRFYAVASDVLVSHNAFIDKMVGDEIVGFFLPCFTGPDTSAAAVAAATAMVSATTGIDEAEGVPVGIGAHTGNAYFGTVSAADGAFSDLTALGDAVNVAARLASMAGPGEALVSTQCWDAGGGEPRPQTDRRSLRLKGRRQTIEAVVLTAASVA